MTLTVYNLEYILSYLEDDKDYLNTLLTCKSFYLTTSYDIVMRNNYLARKAKYYDYYSYNAMDYAAINEDLEMVKWLHKNRKESCSLEAMKYADEYKQSEIYKWLDENR